MSFSRAQFGELVCTRRIVELNIAVEVETISSVDLQMCLRRLLG